MGETKKRDLPYKGEDPEKARARGRLYYHEHKKEKIAYGKKWREKNKERVNKWNRQNYLKRKQQSAAAGRRRRLRLIHQLIDILGTKCKCGDSDIRHLQFHHKNNDGKKDRKRFHGCSKNMVYYYVNHPEEAREKLDLTCANCHAEISWESRNCEWVKRYERIL